MSSIFDQGNLFDAFGPYTPPPPPPTPPSGYLGRFQLGDYLPLSVVTVDSLGYPTPPTGVPLATVKDTNGNVVDTYFLTFDVDTTAWYRYILIDSRFSIGPFTIEYAYSVPGHEVGLLPVGGTLPLVLPAVFSSDESTTGSFDIIRGGDGAGKVISVYYYERPEARYVIGQVESGRILIGKNPRI